jgi:ATP-binding cassette subfamily F protein uup
VKALSGGECNRLLLARLFSQPANMLVMDEPTNDLDIETLELLEELLANFQGTLLLVSHDRAFLDNVVTSTLVFEGNGNIQEYIGGYQDWLKQRKQTQPIAKQSKPVEIKTEKTETKQQNKLTYKEQQELKTLPKTIEKLEKEQIMLQETMSNPDFYKNTQEKITEATTRLKAIETSLEQAYEQWQILENKDKK